MGEFPPLPLPTTEALKRRPPSQLRRVLTCNLAAARESMTSNTIRTAAALAVAEELGHTRIDYRPSSLRNYRVKIASSTREDFAEFQRRYAHAINMAKFVIPSSTRELDLTHSQQRLIDQGTQIYIEQLPPGDQALLGALLKHHLNLLDHEVARLEAAKSEVPGIIIT